MRRVYHADARQWLERNAPLRGASLITSLPDVSSFPDMGLDAWKGWFIDAAAQVLDATTEEGVTLFYQSDVKVNGLWIDKSYLCQRAAEQTGRSLLWHKIVCRQPAGQPVHGRPGYAHLLCFSCAPHPATLPAYPDVLPSMGEMSWSQAMGSAACELACRFVLTHTTTRIVVDPYCGHGTVLAVANALGLDAVGVERGKKRARKARNLVLPLGSQSVA